VPLAQPPAELGDPGQVLGRVRDRAIGALDDVLDRVDAEAVDAEVEPERGDVEHGLEHRPGGGRGRASRR
jgi:hypothetical protein